ncbi:calpain small subunit 1-like [Lissotriton helveticus]
MFLVKQALGGISKGGQAGGIMNVIGGLIPRQGGSSGGGGGGSSAGGSRGGGGGGGGGGCFGGAGGILGGIINIISEAAASYNPEPPPPPRSNFTKVEANESPEVRQFRRLFLQLAREDMEVCPTEMMNILNKVVTRPQDLRTEGFSLDSCRSMVAVMDSDGTGKLGFDLFKYLSNIKKWQCVFKSFDRNQEGFIRSSEIPAALQAAGFQLNEQLQQMLEI